MSERNGGRIKNETDDRKGSRHKPTDRRTNINTDSDRWTDTEIETHHTYGRIEAGRDRQASVL